MFNLYNAFANTYTFLRIALNKFNRFSTYIQTMRRYIMLIHALATNPLSVRQYRIFVYVRVSSTSWLRYYPGNLYGGH